MISIVIPVFNETETLPELHSRLSERLDRIGHDYEIVFVNDGSHDGSREMIQDIARADEHVVGLRLSRNFGHEAAIEAGLRAARGDAVAVMDADMQDSPDALVQLIRAWEDGADVAYAVRKDRKESAALRLAFHGFYRLASRVMSIDLPEDAGPFSLMSRRAVDVMNQMQERNRYFPGLRAFTGFRQVAVEVERGTRFAGETKYSLTRRTAGALNAIVSFSKLPLRAATVLGLIMAGLSVVAGLWVVIASIINGGLQPGWTSLMAVVLFLSSVQLLTLGILGEYLGKVYDEVRRRPNFVVADRYEHGEDASRALPTPDRRASDEVR